MQYLMIVASCVLQTTTQVHILLKYYKIVKIVLTVTVTHSVLTTRLILLLLTKTRSMLVAVLLSTASHSNHSTEL